MPQFLIVHRFKLILLLAALLIGVGAWFWRTPPRNPQLGTPALALQALPQASSLKSLYYNGPARPWLVALRPDLLGDADRDPNSERSRGLVQAVQSPELFRRLDRQFRFDLLLLVGDPSQYRPLLDHLIKTKDWSVSYLDHTSVVFKRQSEASWQPSDLDPILKSFPNSRDQAIFLAQAAQKLLALQLDKPAKSLLDRATQADQSTPELWSAQAVYHTNHGQWKDALACADRALSIDESFLPALASKTQIFYSTRRFNEALSLSNELIQRQPDEPGLLFYHSKIAHQTHAYQMEIETLHKLIAMAEAGNRPTSGYRIYLAQAYAATSQAAPAIEQFQAALTDPDLSKEQREFADELLAQIKKRSGL